MGHFWQRAIRPRVGWRRAAAAIVFGLASLAADLPASAETPADVAVVGAVAEPQTLDPQGATATNDFRIVSAVFEGLVRFKRGTLEIEPALAESWTLSPDGRVYRFALRKDVSFQDGSPFDAAAVVFTFERMLRADHPFHGTGRFPLAFFFKEIESLVAVDPSTVEFRLSEPFAPFLANLATPTGAIVSPAAVEKYGAGFGRNPVGTGPYGFAAWEPDTGVELRRNENYRGAMPDLRGLVFRPLPDAALRLAALRAGNIDIAMAVDPAALGEIGELPDIHVAEALAPHLWFLILNTGEGALSDRRVRQAINYAIDKRRIVEDVLKGGAEIAAGPVPAAFGRAGDPSVSPYPHDPEKARALLREAGAEGLTLTLLATQDGEGMLDPIGMAKAIEEDLAAVGITVRMQTYEWKTFLANVNPGLAGKADMAEMAWTTTDPDTLGYLALRSASLPAEGGFNAGAYANPEVDRRLEEARSSQDRETRARLYREVQEIVHDDAPWAFVASGKEFAVSGPAIGGLVLEPTFLVDFRTVTKS